MIDIENELFTPIAQALRKSFPGVYVTGESVSGIPSQLPCVSLYEMDNFSPASMIDSSGEEKFSDITYQVTAYSNKASGKKSDCKAMMALVDSMLFAQNFTRQSKTPEVALNEGKIYWQAARYVARTDGKYIYRR